MVRSATAQGCYGSVPSLCAGTATLYTFKRPVRPAHPVIICLRHASLQIVEDDAFTDWAVQRHVLRHGRKLSLRTFVPSYAVLEVPESAHGQRVLAGDLLKLGGFDPELEEGLWISSWDIWSEWNRELGEEVVVRLRSEQGVRGPLEQASAQLLKLTDRTVANRSVSESKGGK